MFEKAKNFIVNNSSFLDVSSIGRFYAEKVIVVDSPQVHQQSDWPEDISTNYRILKLGDVHVVDGDINAGKRYNDVVVEVSGETKKRAARIYLGRKGQKRLKAELELLHKLWENPRIVQVYGVVKSHDKVGLVYHHDGMLHKVEDVMLHMSPLQRAVTHVTFMAEYLQTIEYAVVTNGAGYIKDHPVRDAGRHPKTTIYPLENGDVGFYVDTLGRLRASLSGRPSKTEEIGYHRHFRICNTGGNPSLNLRSIPNSDLEILHNIKNSGNRIDKSRAIQLISVVHSSFLYIADFSNPDEVQTGWVLGVPVYRITLDPYDPYLYRPDTNFDHLLFLRLFHFEPAVAVKEVKNLSHRTSWWTDNAVTGKVLFKSFWDVNGYTRFEFQVPDETISIDELSIYGIGRIEDESFYRSWLYVAPNLLENTAKMRRYSRLGIVCGVEAYIKISVHFTSLLRHSNEKKIYLFISNFYIEPVTGEEHQPHIYWSFNESGAEPLRFASSIGILGYRVTMRPIVASWDHVFYEGLRYLYEMCGLDTSVISYGSKYVRRSRSSYLDDTILPDSIMRDFNKILQDVYEYPIYKPNIRKFRDISSLSKIGIMFLEDCRQLKNTAYETVKLQRKRKRDHAIELSIQREEWRGDDWIWITSSDIHSDSSDSDAEEI